MTKHVPDRVLSIHPAYAVSYFEHSPDRKYCITRARETQKKAAGILSKKSMQRIKLAFQWLCLSSYKKKVYSIKQKKSFTFKIAFITLTLSGKQSHSDKYIRLHMLEPFLKWLYRSHNVVNYIWKAETQKNGNIHFHITINKFVHHRSIRHKWNQIQQNHGYTQNQKVENPITDINSTDIKAVKSEKQIANYMIKYFCKNEPDKRKVECTLWGCSKYLNMLPMTIYSNDTDFDCTHKAVGSYENSQNIGDRYCDIYIYKKKIFNLLPDVMKEAYQNRIAYINEEDKKMVLYKIMDFN